MMVLHLMPYKILACGFTDVGLVRQNNEDVWTCLPQYGFYVLADGMGGHQAGEVASRETVNALCRIIKRKKGFQKEGMTLEDVRNGLQQAIIHVNQMIFKMSRSEIELRGMGTTLCCLLFHEKGLVYGNVGDSRIYRLREKKFDQMTKDHSLLREMIDLGQLNETQASDFLYKNIITRAIGTESKVEPSLKTLEVKPNDIYLICSDGLSDLLTRPEMCAIIVGSSSIQDAARKLIASAKEKGGHDNITVVLAKVEKNNEKEDLS